MKRFLLLCILLFALPTVTQAWTITAGAGGGGNISPKGTITIAGTTGTSQNFTAAAATGYQIYKVLVNGSDKGTAGSYTITYDPAKPSQTITAYFQAKTYTITPSAGAGGTIYPNTAQKVSAGGSKTFNVYPNAGSNVADVKVGGASVGAVSSYTITNVQADTDIVATFTVVQANAGGNRTIVAKSLAGIPSVPAPVNLDGSASTGAGSYVWEILNKPAGSAAVLSSAAAVNPSFSADKAGTYQVKLTVAEGAATSTTTIAVNVVTSSLDASSSCIGCHSTNTAGAAIVNKWEASLHTTDNYGCEGCHVGSDNQMPGIPVKTSVICSNCHSDLRTRFETSSHWNNHLEFGPEFTGGAVEGQVNANESWTTSENGKLMTCSTRCHFKPNLGPNPDAKDSMAVNRPGKDACLACHDPHQPKATYQTTCLECHSGSKHGKVPNEFWGSKHWQSSFEYGPEFANQLNTTVSGGTVTSDGSTTNGVLNANDSYTTTENGSTVTCAYRCHFRPGMGPFQTVGTVLANGKSTGYISYTDAAGNYGPANNVYSRPGGDACMACHDSHGLAATAQSTCYTCHAGGNHGWSVKAFEKSTHFTGTYAKADGMDKEACLACHNAHSTEATFGAYSSLSPVAATGCQTCHTPGSPYGIYNADQSGTAPHFQTGTPDASGYLPTASYITAGGATCADCHYHNNSINAGWAEGGHGSVTAVPWKSDASHNWNGQGTDGVNYQASPQKTNCIRCHSAHGFAQYWDSGFSNINKVYLDPVAKTLDKASAPLVCNGCHTSFKGAVRPLPAGYTKVSSFYGYSTATIAPKKIAVSLQFTDNKNSNLCLPCHSQRASGTEIKALFAAGAFKQYSVGTTTYPHAAQPAAIVDGQGGYEFASAQGYQDRMRHIRIGNYGTGTGYNNTGITSGNCAGCHMTSTKTHNLEAVTADSTSGQINGIVSSTCAKCHPTAFTYQDIQAKKDAFNAAVKTLGNLLVARGFTQDGVNVLAERKAFDMSLDKNGVKTKNNAIAEKNVGAWFNWYLFKTSDQAGYVHNPAYSRRLINDSIDWLDDNVMNDSAAATVFAQQTAGTLTVLEKDQALAQLNNPGCMGCHFGTGSTIAGEAVPGIEQAPHYNTSGALVPGETFTQAQFVTPETQCNYCHGYGHGTDSPGGTVLKDYAESAHGDINGLAWTDYDFKTRATCNACHTTAGFVKAVNSNFTNTAAWGTTGDPTKQVLGCNACHMSTAWKSYSSATGSLTSSIRTKTSGGYVAGMGGYGASAKATVQFSDQGESNVCIPCHATRENGDSLKAGNYNFTNKTFVNPHYLGSAAVWQGRAGFKFYTSTARYSVDKPTHGVQTADLGSINHSFNTRMTTQQQQKGSCVACHLGFKGNHTFNTYSAVKYGFMNRDTKVQGEAVDGCLGCHSGTSNGYNRYYPTVENGQGSRTSSGGYVQQRALDFLKWQFEQSGIYFNNGKNAYFFTDNTYTTGVTNWTTQLVGKDNGNGTGLETMGAAMNLKLLSTDKGAAAHNAAFTKAVIADSLVYLQHGNVGDRSSTAAINNISFTGYSTAITPALGGAPTDGNPSSISNLKSFLTSGGKRR